MERSRDLGAYLFERARELERHAIVGDVRGGLGLMCAVELIRDHETRERFPKAAGVKRSPRS